ncbi:MAG: hypothetical protein AB7L18_12480 [Hyphomicrobiaceae bacterium]
MPDNKAIDKEVSQKDFQEEQIQEGQNVHSIPQFFKGELTSLWPALALGLIAIVVILWFRFH